MVVDTAPQAIIVRNPLSKTQENNSSNFSLQKERQKQQQVQQQIKKLQKVDQKVRQHEMAHLAAGAGVTKSGPHYQYVKGPDNKLYAVGGEVPIDVSPAQTPQQTIKKMEKVIAAALAPADPSPQDLRVAAKATQIIAQMQTKIPTGQFIDIYV